MSRPGDDQLGRDGARSPVSRRDRSAEWFYLPPDMQTPVEPDFVGRLVAEAIESNTFAVFTHAQDAERFRTWRLDIEKSLTDAIEGSPRPPRLD